MASPLYAAITFIDAWRRRRFIILRYRLIFNTPITFYAAARRKDVIFRARYDGVKYVLPPAITCYAIPPTQHLARNVTTPASRIHYIARPLRFFFSARSRHFFVACIYLWNVQ